MFGHSMRHRPASLLALGLAGFLLLFTAFAFHHVYAYDELANPHGCQIGQWVHQGQAALAAAVVLSMALRLLGADLHPQILLLSRRLDSRLLARAPPRLSLS